LTPATPVTGTIELGEIDSYTFVANAGEAIQLRFVDTYAGAMVPLVALYDPAGKLVDYNYSGTVATLSKTAPSTGTYTVLVYDGSSGSAATGNYEVSLTVTSTKP
jgi:hypothetical protein